MTASLKSTAPQASVKRAVLYLRVSTPRQMNTAVDIDPEGNSIATQRETCLAKAQTLDAAVQAEFVEPGNSAQSIEKRPVFKQMLAYLEEHREIDYVIVYMRSRAFRNSIDAAITKRALSMFGIRIVSCKEDFGTGPVADAMETVSDAFNELQVRQNGEDIRLKLRHKALNGGTITRAKLGYLNTRAEHEGRLFNSIGVDPVRAPLVLKAFELYATGEYSIDLLTAAMADLGLTTRPSTRWPREQPVSDSKLHRMLSDTYYAGWVTVDGQLIPGRHDAIISQALFDRVQEVLNFRSARGQRDRVLSHYLKGLLYCDRCHQAGRTSRLIYTEATGNGGRYGYYVCRSRQEGICDLPHLAVAQVEDAICNHYHQLTVGEKFATAVRDQLDATISEQQQLARDLHTTLTAQLTKLEVREERLIDLAADGQLDKAKIHQRSNAIQLERARIQTSLADTGAQLAVGAQRLQECLNLVADPARLYEDAPDDVRRQLNQTFYRSLYLDDTRRVEVANDILKPPFDEIQHANWVYDRQKELALGNRSKRHEEQKPFESNKNRPDLSIEPASNNRTSVLADVFFGQWFE